MRSCAASRVVRRPRFVGRGEEGKMARVGPVRTARVAGPPGTYQTGAPAGLAPPAPCPSPVGSAMRTDPGTKRSPWSGQRTLPGRHERGRRVRYADRSLSGTKRSLWSRQRTLPGWHERGRRVRYADRHNPRLFPNRIREIVEIHRCAPPIRGILALTNETVKGAPRPVDGTLHQPVLHRVVMDVIEVTLQIPLVADDVLPEPALEDTTPSVVLLVIPIPNARRRRGQAIAW